MLYEALLQPDRDPARQWLRLLDDEVPPRVLDAEVHARVVWSSLWPRRADARIRFDLPPDRSGQGTDLTWSLLVDEPAPDPSLLGHLRKRINQLVNADLRSSLGQ